MLRGVHPQMGWNQKWKFDKSFLLKGFRTNLTELKEGLANEQTSLFFAPKGWNYASGL